MMRKSLAIAFICLLSVPALAQEYDMKKAPVVRNKLNFRAGRHELSPGFGMTLSDSYFRNIIMSVSYDYHAMDWLNFGITGGYALPIKTGLAQNIEDEKTTETAAYSIPATHLGVVANAHVGFTPLSGKFLLVGAAVVHYDLHLMGGVGTLQVLWNSEAAGDVAADDEFVIAPVFGGGIRFFVDRGISISVDVVDYFGNMYTAAKDDLPGEVTPPERNWTHNMAAMLTVNFFLPFTIKAEED